MTCVCWRVRIFLKSSFHVSLNLKIFRAFPGISVAHGNGADESLIGLMLISLRSFPIFVRYVSMRNVSYK